MAVRFRPFNDREQQELQRSAHIVAPFKLEQQQVKSLQNLVAQPFKFDQVFDPTASQSDVHQFCGSAMVTDVIDGYNGTIFAYGQTGSGKTHTMFGEAANEGLIPRIVRDLFERIEAVEAEYTQMPLPTSVQSVLVEVSYMEIYNEEVLDLLGPGRNLRVRQTKSQGVYVEGLTRLKVKTVGDMLQLIQIGAAKRKVNATAINNQSSRSH